MNFFPLHSIKERRACAVIERMNSPNPTPAPGTGTRPARARDVTWDRILFQPPSLLNPRLVFDPMPFRSQLLPRSWRSRAPAAR